MTHILFKKILKENMEYNINSKQMTKSDAIDITNMQLAIIDNQIINEQIEKYNKQKDEIIKKYYDDMNKLTDSYYDELIKIL